ncbi:hypothetical protein LTR66_010622 [Elasticomyces elasticus]|nr:hypothetical protein LTR66_010622 [Elasticomyces elasticus]
MALQPSNGLATPKNDHTTSLWARYESLKNLDVHKNALVEDALTQCQRFVEQYREKCEELEHERKSNLSNQHKIFVMQSAVQRLQGLMNRDPFILVLIDGDGMIAIPRTFGYSVPSKKVPRRSGHSGAFGIAIDNSKFHSDLLKEGESGGKRAAALLHDAATKYALANVQELPSEFDIVARIYANVKGLADVCVRAGLVDTVTKVEDFVRGFTCGKNLFDFVDVGYDKGLADHKLREIFKLHLYDFHCRQIFFGCSRDNGPAHILDEFSTNDEIKSRVTLLEGTPFEKKLATLQFDTTKFEGLFRNTKIDLHGKDLLSDFPPFSTASLHQSNLQKVFRPLSPIGSQKTSSTATSGPISPKTTATLPHRQSRMRQDSSATSNSSEISQSKSNTWAAAAQKAAARSLEDRPVPKMSPPGVIRRNRKGQRIDPALPPYNKNDCQRIRNLRLCNVHHLRGDCLPGSKCPHNHDRNMSKNDLDTLRLIAYMLPCVSGGACEDAKCIYGHRCPYPVPTQGSMRGSGCFLGAGCRFAPDLHDIDMVPVKHC